jgi:carboxylesterase
MIGCLCLHGFTGGPFELEPLVDYLKEHTTWKISSPTLPGHENPKEFYKVPYLNWVRTAESAYFKLKETCETIYVIGFSMGGVIAGYLASKYKIDKLVLLSPAAYYISPKHMLQDVLEIVKAVFTGKITDHELWQRYKRKLKATPLGMTTEFRRLVRKLRPYFKNIKTPTLILHGEKDGVVPKRSAEFIHKTIQSEEKHLHFLKGSKHIVCHDVDQDELIKIVGDFLPVY